MGIALRFAQGIYNMAAQASEIVKPNQIVSETSSALQHTGPLAPVSMDGALESFVGVTPHIPNVPMSDGLEHAGEGALAQNLHTEVYEPTNGIQVEDKSLSLREKKSLPFWEKYNLFDSADKGTDWYREREKKDARDREYVLDLRLRGNDNRNN